MTAVQAIAELQKFDEYKDLNDYNVKKTVGGGKQATVGQLRQALMVLMANGGNGEPIVISMRKTPTKVPKKTPTKPLPPSLGSLSGFLCMKHGCKLGYCNTKTGKCISTIKSGRPRGEKKLMEEFGDDYYVDEKHLLVGTKKDVKGTVEHWRKSKTSKGSPPKAPKKLQSPLKKPSPAKKPKKLPSPPKKPSPVKQKTPKKKTPTKKPKVSKVPAKGCGASDMTTFDDYDECPKEKVCNVLTRKCVANNAANRRGNSLLNVGGRIILGDKGTIEKLQKVLGGDIEGGKPSPKKPSPIKPNEEEEGDISIKPSKLNKKPKSPPKNKSPPKDKSPAKEKPKKPSPKKPSPIKPVQGVGVSDARAKVWKTFTDCLKEQGAK